MTRWKISRRVLMLMKMELYNLLKKVDYLTQQLSVYIYLRFHEPLVISWMVSGNRIGSSTGIYIKAASSPGTCDILWQMWKAPSLCIRCTRESVRRNHSGSCVILSQGQLNTKMQIFKETRWEMSKHFTTRK